MSLSALLIIAIKIMQNELESILNWIESSSSVQLNTCQADILMSDAQSCIDLILLIDFVIWFQNKVAFFGLYVLANI